MPQKYVLAIDAPDPDNLVLMRVAQNMFGKENILGTILTGRPIVFDAAKDTPLEDWNYDHSYHALRSSASRLKNFMRGYDKDSKIKVFDGGIAPRTLVPHHLHFVDYNDYNDLNSLKSHLVPELDDIAGLGNEIINNENEITILVGGPMTGLASLLQRFPAVSEKISSVHAMYATLGEVKLMDLGGKPRGQKQFNVACDPFAGKYVVDALDCPVYFITSECTRDDRIGFETPNKLADHLESTEGNKYLMGLYNIWFANAVAPRKDNLYIHDVCAAISASKSGKEVYNFERMAVKSIPHLPSEKEKWGTMEFEKDANSNIHVSTELKSPKKYLSLLNEHLR